jgi:hypothetical protein
MQKAKSNVPALGDKLSVGTLFPIQLPLKDEKYLDFLKNEHPDQYERLWAIRKDILKVTGVQHLGELDRRSRDPEFVEEVNERILLTRKALGENLPIEARQREAMKFAKLFDRIKRDLVSRFAPGYTKTLGTRNEVIATHNWGKLLLMAFDTDRNDKVRYESKLKLVMAEHFSRVEQKLRARKDNLEFLADLMDDRIFDPNGEKLGGTKTQWLVTQHDLADDNRCIGFEFMETPPTQLAENELVEQIDFRTMVIPQPDGSKRVIDFMIDIGEKDDESVNLKSIRHPDRDLDELLRDLSRGRLLFKSKEDSEAVIGEMIRRIREPDSRTGVGHEVSVEKEKDKVGGDGGKPTIPCYKFNMVIDGRDYEFQSFLPREYRDYFIWKKAAWCKHEVDRFFDNGLLEVIWPKEHYPGLDRRQLAKEAFDREYEREWASRRILPDVRSDSETENESLPRPLNGSGHSVGMPKALAASAS